MEVAIFFSIYSFYESIQQKVATGKPCKRRSESKDELGSSNLTDVKHVLKPLNPSHIREVHANIVMHM